MFLSPNNPHIRISSVYFNLDTHEIDVFIRKVNPNTKRWGSAKWFKTEQLSPTVFQFIWDSCKANLVQRATDSAVPLPVICFTEKV